MYNFISTNFLNCISSNTFMISICDSVRVSLENLCVLDVFVLMVTVGLFVYLLALMECLFNRNQEIATNPKETSEKFKNKNSCSKTKTFFKFFMKKKKVRFNEKDNRVFIIIWKRPMFWMLYLISIIPRHLSFLNIFNFFKNAKSFIFIHSSTAFF